METNSLISSNLESYRPGAKGMFLERTKIMKKANDENDRDGHNRNEININWDLLFFLRF